MANKQHVARLRKDVDAWNQWREKNPNIKPDLNGADLNGADLTGAKLTGAKLNRTRLEANALSAFQRKTVDQALFNPIYADKKGSLNK